MWHCVSPKHEIKMVVILTCVLILLGSRVVVWAICLGDLFELSDRSNETILLRFPPLLALVAAILGLSVTTTPILPLGHVTSSCIGSIQYKHSNSAH